jgi:hypothetical protein
LAQLENAENAENAEKWVKSTFHPPRGVGHRRQQVDALCVSNYGSQWRKEKRQPKGCRFASLGKLTASNASERI